MYYKVVGILSIPNPVCPCCCFWKVLPPASGSFLLPVLMLILRQELEVSGAAPSSLGSASNSLSSDLCLPNSVRHWALFWSLLVLQPGNSPQAADWSQCRAHVAQFSSLKDLCPHPCFPKPENCCFMCFIWLANFLCRAAAGRG